MSNAKVVMGQAANTLVKPLEVEDVFSTYLYEGNASTQTITNGIDLSGEGGLVWIKNRDYTYAHMLHDTEATGVENVLRLPNTGGISYDVDTLTSFNSDGFTIGADSEVNENGTGWTGHTSWTFRKAPKFFDVVTYTGDGTSNRAISHNLGVAPAFITVKQTSGGGSDWTCYHRSLGESAIIYLNATNAATTSNSFWDNTAPTSSTFTVSSTSSANASGETYVAYLFAHNDGDGGFNGGDIIKCGSFSVNGSYEADVDIGFEPQWVLIKPAEDTGSWLLFDTMRGAAVNGDAAWLAPDLSQQEANTANRFWPTATGFHIGNYGIPAGNDIIYIAIRRGTKAPESATEVFEVDNSTRTSDGSSPRHRADFPVDMALYKDRAGGAGYISDRLRQKWLITNTTDSEFSSVAFDFQNGWIDSSTVVSANLSWMWKRAPGFFDVVAYTGTGSARTVSHNLTVAPEMMWVKSRTSGTASYQWWVYHKDLGNDRAAYLNQNYVPLVSSQFWNDTTPSDSVFSLGNGTGVNWPSNDYIAYLFASLPGISKVGSYTGTGAQQVIDCGFTTGARFVLIKKSSASGDWGVYDTARGIVAGSDNILELNTTDEQVVSDVIDPDPSGFAVTGTNTFRTNDAGETYIFYAIA